MHHLILCAVVLLAAPPETSPEAEAVLRARAQKADASASLADAERKAEVANLNLAKAEAALKAAIAKKKEELALLEEALAGKAPKPIRRGARPRTQTKPEVDDDKSQKQKRKPSYVKEKRYIAPVQDNNDAQKVLQERKRRRQGSEEKEEPRAILRVRIKKKPERLWVDGERIKGVRTHKIEAAGDHSFRVKVVYRGQDGRMRTRRKTIAVKAGRTEKLNIGR